MERRVAALLGLLVACMPPDARGAWELGVGLVDEIDGRQSTMATVGWLAGPRSEWEVLLGHLRGRDRDGTAAVATPTTTFAAVSRRLFWRGWFLSSGIALADTGGDNPVLSGPFQFMSGLGWRGRDWTLSLRHLSNANTRGENRGETFLLVSYHW